MQNDTEHCPLICILLLTTHLIECMCLHLYIWKLKENFGVLTFTWSLLTLIQSFRTWRIALNDSVFAFLVTCIWFHSQIQYTGNEAGTIHYCKHVSLDEYENQRLTGSQQALATLLEEIIQDKHMALKEKKKRLKQVPI